MWYRWNVEVIEEMNNHQDITKLVTISIQNVNSKRREMHKIKYIHMYY